MIIRIAIALLVVFCGFSHASAQLLDLDCYEPASDNPAQRVSLYGSQDGQRLGGNIVNIGPRKPGEGSTILLQGMPGNIPFLTAIESRSNFKINSPKVLQHSTLPAGELIASGHFRNLASIDVIIKAGWYKIFWADDNGDFDSARYTILRPRRDSALQESIYQHPYITDLNGDNLSDIVMTSNRFYSENSPRNGGYLSYFEGGIELFESGQLASPNEFIFTLKEDGLDKERSISQGDWRGVGRDDWIGVNKNGDAFYFRNDPPFNLSKFRKAMLEDTLWARWESAHEWYSPGIGQLLPNSFSMSVFPKASWDKSEDFLPRLPFRDSLGYGIWMFRGGSEFGSRRLKIDSPDFHIKHPGRIDGGFAATSTANLRNCGDMSGKGYPILQISGYSMYDSYHLFYATGQALDAKADMFIKAYGIHDAGRVDTITANGDRLQDVIIGRPNFLSQAHFDKDWSSVGLIEIVYGSSKIPTKINPAMAVDIQRPVDNSLSVFPNPVDRSTTISFSTQSRSQAEIRILNVLGATVHAQTMLTTPGENTLTWERPTHLASGIYVLLLEGEGIQYRAKLSLK